MKRNLHSANSKIENHVQPEENEVVLCVCINDMADCVRICVTIEYPHTHISSSTLAALNKESGNC